MSKEKPVSPDVPESYLCQLYISQPLSLPEDIKAYVANPQKPDSEIKYLKEYVKTKDADLTRIIFIVEVVSKSLRKHSEFRDYMKLLVNVMERFNEYQHSVFILRVVRSIVGTRFYVPISFYLIRILKAAIGSRNIIARNKKITYDSIKLVGDDVKSEEHQMFVIGEVNTLLMQHLSTFSKNIGFPEIADVVISELRRFRVGIYKEIVGDMIFNINKQKEYVVEKRNGLKLSGIDGKTISSFEGSIERTL